MLTSIIVTLFDINFIKLLIQVLYKVVFKHFDVVLVLPGITDFVVLQVYFHRQIKYLLHVCFQMNQVFMEFLRGHLDKGLI